MIRYEIDHNEELGRSHCLWIHGNDLNRLAGHQKQEKFIFDTATKFDLIENLIPK